MEKLVSVGFGNMVNSSKVIAVISPESAPVKRMVQAAKEAGNAIDVTQGRKTKSVIVMENGQYVLSALQTETIAGRMKAEIKEEILSHLEALENSDETIIVGDFKNMHMLAARDRYMIDNSDRIIAVYDERSNIKSGTYRALMYAKEKAVEVRQINWMDFCK